MTEARVINIDTIYTRERTMKLGMTCNDRDENIRSGFIVYSSCYPKDKDHNFVRVLDMEGNQVHQWDMGNKMPGLWSYIPNPECISRYVKPNQKGCLFAITKIPPAVTVKQDFVAWEADRGGLMELIDFDGIPEIKNNGCSHRVDKQVLFRHPWIWHGIGCFNFRT